jgi:hypothetical protein
MDHDDKRPAASGEKAKKCPLSITGKLGVALAAAVVGCAVVALSGTATLDYDHYGIVLDMWGEPTGVVLTDPGFHWVGRLHLDSYLKGPDATDYVEEIAAPGDRGNVIVSYRVVRGELPADLQVSLYRAHVFGRGRMSEIAAAAAKSVVTDWIVGGAGDASGLGAAVSAKVSSGLAARGVAVSADRLPVAVDILSVRRPDLPAPVVQNNISR